MAAQVLFFTGALGLGVAVGVLYDIFRILRVRLRLPLLGGILDLLFWLVVTAALFLYTVTAGSGEVRGYLVLAVLGGAAAYFWLLSRWFLWLGYRLADFLGLVWGLVTLPLVLLARLGKKIEKNAKKSFHYRRKWYKIGVLHREMDGLHRSDQPAAEGGPDHETQESVPSDQAGGSGSAHRPRPSPGWPSRSRSTPSWPTPWKTAVIPSGRPTWPGASWAWWSRASTSSVSLTETFERGFYRQLWSLVLVRFWKEKSQASQSSARSSPCRKASRVWCTSLRSPTPTSTT